MPADAGECLLPSLVLFDGYSRLWHRRPILFLAPDGIAARLGPETDLAVLLDHEAFHIYHDASAPTVVGPLLWERLWREGLATYASGKLNPLATSAQVLLSDRLPDVSRATLAAAARHAFAGLDSDKLVSPLFDIGREHCFRHG